MARTKSSQGAPIKKIKKNRIRNTLGISTEHLNTIKDIQKVKNSQVTLFGTGVYYVTHHSYSGTWPCTPTRLEIPLKKVGLGLMVSRNPRRAYIYDLKKPDRTSEVEFPVNNNFQEVAYVVHQLQTLEGKEKKKYLKRIGLL